MTGVELALASVGTADLCFKYGNKLIHICHSFGNAEKEIDERILCIENYWTRTRLQLDMLRSIWKTLDTEHQTIQRKILYVLLGKLTSAISKIEKVTSKSDSKIANSNNLLQPASGVKRWKYALLKDNLDRIIEDLANWQNMFDPSWYFTLVTSSSLTDNMLQTYSQPSQHSLVASSKGLRDAVRGTEQEQRSIFLPSDGLSSADIRRLPFSCCDIAQRKDSYKRYILDYVPHPGYGTPDRAIAEIRNLARKLSHTEPVEFGLLSCYGVIKVPHREGPPSFTFVFKTVDGHSEPRSLRDHLLAGYRSHSLSDRLNLAKDLARSISFVHTLDLVHKNVRPETILLATNSTSLLGHCFLVGFQEFRPTIAHSERFGDLTWEKNLYRHPQRQGSRPIDEYIMQHDIYSLGVCMLEIGMWESLVQYHENGTCFPSEFLQSTSGDVSVWNFAALKDHLLSLARNILPTRMGSKYARVVETCLTCLDEETGDFGDEQEFKDEDGIRVGLRYIQKVLLQLDYISM